MCKHSIVASYSSSSKCKSGFYKHDDLTDQAHDKSEIFYIDLGHLDEHIRALEEELQLLASSGTSINDVVHFFGFLMPPFPLSPILLNRLME